MTLKHVETTEQDISTTGKTETKTPKAQGPDSKETDVEVSKDQEAAPEEKRHKKWIRKKKDTRNQPRKSEEGNPAEEITGEVTEVDKGGF